MWLKSPVLCRASPSRTRNSVSGQKKGRSDVFLLVMYLARGSPSPKDLDTGCGETQAVDASYSPVRRSSEALHPIPEAEVSTPSGQSIARRTGTKGIDNWHVPEIASSSSKNVCSMPPNFAEGQVDDHVPGVSRLCRVGGTRRGVRRRGRREPPQLQTHPTKVRAEN